MFSAFCVGPGTSGHGHDCAIQNTHTIGFAHHNYFLFSDVKQICRQRI